ncbi:MAG TPA: trypsin-like peptidase domain-containing protein [Nocardioides sp.]|nr:trypsin-like peptidase domain-containing protein [Nocardioides sp.]
MSDAHEPDEQAPDEPTQPLAGWSPQPDGQAYGRSDAPADDTSTDRPSHDEEPPAAPTVPLDSHAPGVASGPVGPQDPTQGFGPAYVGPGPGPYAAQPGYAQPGYAQPGYAQPGYSQPGASGRSRKLPVWVWPAVAALALIVGIVGGVAGGALQDELASQRGTVDNGLGGVRTQTAAPLDAENGSVAAVAQALLPSTVQIVAEFDGQEAGATGSGFVLDREGHVVTNNHVVASAAEEDGPIVVIDHAGDRHEATVVGRSAVYDLAVLDVDGAASLEPAALGASQVLHVGDQVIAFGAPLGLSQTVTAGIVSALNRPVTTSGESDDQSSYINAVQTDAAINPGNSGGPLVNLAGEVVGVNSAIATNGGASSESGNIGVGFAIPIEQVVTTVDQILRTGKAEYPVIGAQVRTGGEPDAEGATITEVMPDTPAERAGLQEDDLITAVGDQPVNDGIALIVAIRTHLPGEIVEMSVVRGGEEQIVQVELDGKVG